jgi:hypothetical protein
MVKVKVHARGGALSWESLCPSTRIPNRSPSQVRFNPDESILRFLRRHSLKSVTLARWDWTFAFVCDDPRPEETMTGSSSRDISGDISGDITDA